MKPFSPCPRCGFGEKAYGRLREAGLMRGYGELFCPLCGFLAPYAERPTLGQVARLRLGRKTYLPGEQLPLFFLRQEGGTGDGRG